MSSSKTFLLNKEPWVYIYLANVKPPPGEDTNRTLNILIYLAWLRY